MVRHWKIYFPSVLDRIKWRWSTWPKLSPPTPWLSSSLPRLLSSNVWTNGKRVDKLGIKFGWIHFAKTAYKCPLYQMKWTRWARHLKWSFQIPLGRGSLSLGASLGSGIANHLQEMRPQPTLGVWKRYDRGPVLHPPSYGLITGTDFIRKRLKRSSEWNPKNRKLFTLEVSLLCFVHRSKNDLLYYAEYLPTISTQLKILSSVKAATPSDISVRDKYNHFYRRLRIILQRKSALLIGGLLMKFNHIKRNYGNVGFSWEGKTAVKSSNFKKTTET